MPDTPTPSLPLDSPVSPSSDEAPDTLPESAPTLEEGAPAPQQSVSTPEEGAAQSEEGATEDVQPSPSSPPAPSTVRMRGRRTLPASPVERARLEAQEGEVPSEIGDRTTMVAFGLLFIVPLLIIILSLLLFLPFIHSQLTEEPSGAQVQTSANGLTPTR